jgi:hypothetical protein
MMQDLSPTSELSPRRVLPAWVFSFLVHFSAIVALGVAIQPGPRGAAEEPGRSAGIVLKRTSAEGDLYEGEEDVPPAAAEQSPPTDVLSALPNEADRADFGEDAPQVSGAAPSVANGQPNAGQSTSSGQRGSPSGGGDANVTVFGVQGTGTKFVYLFDRSSSMEGAPLAAAKRQLLESLASLEGTHQFHIIFFNTKTQKLDIAGGTRRIAFATDRNKQLAANFVGGITADGGTDRLTALREAIGFAPDVIFFLTDADDPMTPSELSEIDQANQRAQAAICAIEFGRRQSPSPENFLVKLARESGGQYGYVNTMSLAK